MFRFALAALVSIILSGCAGYTTYPAPEPGTTSDAAFNSPNVPPAPDVIFTALEYSIDRFPINGPYAINLPPELDAKRVDYIIGLLKDPNAAVLTESNQDLPTYHVARIWIRAGRAQVDVFRPVTDIPGPQGGQVTQMVTVNLKPHFTRWQVESARSAAIGVASPPAPAFRDPNTRAIATAGPAQDDN